MKCAFIFIFTFLLINSVRLETFKLVIGTENYVNVVDPRFLSFTIDPKYLTSQDIVDNKETSCMASALTPAYLRIAGPTTTQLQFDNTSISLKPDVYNNDQNQELNVTYEDFSKFYSWSKDQGLRLVFGLNNDAKNEAGMWDANQALSLLTAAERLKIDSLVWQLGYECKNQTIEEYLNDLQTLKVISETFHQNVNRNWSITSGDITPCLQITSKSDFKDFVSLSNDFLDAIFLDGNSSSYELERMSRDERSKLLRDLSKSKTPLWLSEKPVFDNETELQRAASWMHSLGQSARGGFSVHFHELKEDEITKPTLSFYMALLFKNLVGERVLNVNLETPSERAFMFAHCTSLRHKAVPGAVTLYAANMDDEAARFSLKLSKREEGGDIMQFVLATDASGNIIVNGRAMYYEGNIRPVVKRVRPYKSLLLNLPPKSFGFWVLANTHTDACFDSESGENLVRAETENEISRKRREAICEAEISKENTSTNEDYIDDLEIKHKNPIQTELKDKNNKMQKRQIGMVPVEKRKIKRPSLLAVPKTKKTAEERTERPKTGLLAKFLSNLQLNSKFNSTKHLRKPIVLKRVNNSKLSRSNIKKTAITPQDKKQGTRNRRSAKTRNTRQDSEDTQDYETINEIEIDEPTFVKFGKLIHKMNTKFNKAIDDTNDEYEKPKSHEEQFVIKTRIADDDTSINLSEKSNHGILRNTFGKIISVVDDMNQKLNKLINSLSFLE